MLCIGLFERFYFLKQNFGLSPWSRNENKHFKGVQKSTQLILVSVGFFNQICSGWYVPGCGVADPV